MKKEGKGPLALIFKEYSPQGLLTLINSQDKPTQQGLAIEYRDMGFPIFPCNKDKAPIVDHSLGFRNGFKDATRDLKLIAKAWHKYPDAGIGLALPPGVIVFDCDVLKDAEKRPILKDRKPDVIGLKSFQELIIKLNLHEADLNTLTVKTQSEGRHFFYLMPEGTSSFNHTHAMEGLDLKGYGGYVVLPNSRGQYGRYEFLNLTEMKPIPEDLLKWVLQFREAPKKEITVPDSQEVEDSRINDFVSEILPSWNRALEKHMGNEMRLAVAGTLYHYGWPETKAQQVMKMIIHGSKVPGASDKNAVKYTYANGRAGKPVYGFSTLKKLIEELEGIEQ